MATEERKQKIRDAMRTIVRQNVSGQASLAELSKETGIHPNGLSQTIGTMEEFRRVARKKNVFEFDRK
jgi:DNA-binding HxlR family transcriptional regulator